MPTVTNRRLLPIKGSNAPGGGEDDPNQPPNKEVPQELQDSSEEEPSDEESESEASESSSDDEDDDDDDPMSWTKETLVRAIKFATRSFARLKKRFERLQDQKEKVENDASKIKVKHQVAITSKNTMISNLRNQLKIQSESKAAIRQSFENRYREEMDTLKQKHGYQRKRNQDLLRDLAKSEKEAKQFCTEKEIARRKLSKVNLDYVEKNKEVSLLKSENKQLKKEAAKKTLTIQKYDNAKLEAQVQIEKEKMEQKKLIEAEKTARKMMEQQAKDIDYEKKKELAQHQSEIRIIEKAKVRKKKEEEDQLKLDKQNKQLDSHLATIMRSVPATRNTLPNNGQFLGANSFVQAQLLQQAQQMQAPPSTPANNLPSMLLRLGGGSSGSSNDDAISLVTQPPVMSPPVARRQLTLTQMERDSTPEQQQQLPRGVQKLTDDASGETYYMMNGSDGSKNFYMSYEEMMAAAANSKTGESTIARRDWQTEATEANITAAVHGRAAPARADAAAAAVIKLIIYIQSLINSWIPNKLKNKI